MADLPRSTTCSTFAVHVFLWLCDCVFRFLMKHLLFLLTDIFLFPFMRSCFGVSVFQGFLSCLLVFKFHIWCSCFVSFPSSRDSTLSFHPVTPSSSLALHCFYSVIMPSSLSSICCYAFSASFVSSIIHFLLAYARVRVQQWSLIMLARHQVFHIMFSSWYVSSNLQQSQYIVILS